MGFIGAERDPRVVLFGDITGVPIQTIHRFFETAGHPPYGGSFPSSHNRQETEAVKEVSGEDRIRQMLQDLSLLGRIDDIGRTILILDRNPESLVRGVADRQTDFNPGIFSHTTVISLGPGEPIDYVDPNTNLRIVTLPRYCYPTHPTPAS